MRPRRPVLDGRPQWQHAPARDRTLARGDAHDARDAAPAQLHRLHLLHPLRVARPGRLRERLRAARERRSSARSSAGAHELLHGDPVRPRRRVSGPCTQTTASASAARRPSAGTGGRDRAQRRGRPVTWQAPAAAANPTFTGHARSPRRPAGDAALEQELATSLRRPTCSRAARRSCSTTTMTVTTERPVVQPRTMRCRRTASSTSRTDAARRVPAPQSYALNTGCGDVWVKGTTAELTIAADNDVIIYGDLDARQDELLFGLIANNFVRIFHPVLTTTGCGNSPTGPARSGPEDRGGDPGAEPVVHHDNWYCGGLGTSTSTARSPSATAGPSVTGNSTNAATSRTTCTTTG